MKLFVFASAAVGAVYLSLGAQAEIVDCRTIADNGKRLMCYDTLNADAPMPALNVAKPKATTIVADKAIQANKAAPDLSGFYFGATFGFGSSTEVDKFRPEIPKTTYYGANDTFRANSPTLGITAGYNAFSGASLFGLQLDISGDTSSKKWSYDDPVEVYNMPQKSGSSYGWEHGKPIGSIDLSEIEGGALQSALSHHYKYREQVSPTISARFGHQFDSVLLYGRIGAGIARIKETYTYDNTKSVYCGSVTKETHYTSPKSTESWNVACNNPYNGDSYSSSRTLTRPTATIAIGAEYHFDRYFTRLEGEMRHVFLDRKLNFSTSTGLTHYKFVTGIGLKF